MPSLKRTFFLALVLGAGAAIAYAAVTHVPARDSFAKPLSGSVSVSDQITLDRLEQVRSAGFRALIDLRPDGESPDQPPSHEVAKAAEQAGLRFAYVPIAHGDIPDNSVEALGQSFARLPEPILLYCRSGRRAARTWALMEASRPGGLNAAQIANAVLSAGQPIDDLRDQITKRVASRSNHE